MFLEQREAASLPFRGLAQKLAKQIRKPEVKFTGKLAQASLFKR
jgi:hypothetical protein